jgi:hypothetical protein
MWRIRMQQIPNLPRRNFTSIHIDMLEFLFDFKIEIILSVSLSLSVYNKNVL